MQAGGRGFESHRLHQTTHAYEASRLAAERRDELLAARTSFVTETVFSHESKVDFVMAAAAAGYLITLHVVLVPEDKVRSRYARLWSLVAAAIAIADEAKLYDNSSASEPFRVVASFERGRAVSTPDWPPWTPKDLRSAR